MFHTLISLFSATRNGCVEPKFFGLKTWWHYLDTDADCNVINFNVLGTKSADSGTSDFFLIALVVVDDLLRLVALICIGYIIYGGILYLISQGSPETTQKAQGTIQNALIGLAICILAVAMVSFAGSKVG